MRSQGRAHTQNERCTRGRGPCGRTASLLRCRSLHCLWGPYHSVHGQPQAGDKIFSSPGSGAGGHEAHVTNYVDPGAAEPGRWRGLSRAGAPGRLSRHLRGAATPHPQRRSFSDPLSLRERVRVRGRQELRAISTLASPHPRPLPEGEGVRASSLHAAWESDRHFIFAISASVNWSVDAVPPKSRVSVLPSASTAS